MGTVPKRSGQGGAASPGWAWPHRPGRRCHRQGEARGAPSDRSLLTTPSRRSHPTPITAWIAIDGAVGCIAVMNFPPEVGAGGRVSTQPPPLLVKRPPGFPPACAAPHPHPTSLPIFPLPWAPSTNHRCRMTPQFFPIFQARPPLLHPSSTSPASSTSVIPSPLSSPPLGHLFSSPTPVSLVYFSPFFSTPLPFTDSSLFIPSWLSCLPFFSLGLIQRAKVALPWGSEHVCRGGSGGWKGACSGLSPPAHPQYRSGRRRMGVHPQGSCQRLSGWMSESGGGREAKVLGRELSSTNMSVVGEITGLLLNSPTRGTSAGDPALLPTSPQSRAPPHPHPQSPLIPEACEFH